MPNIRQLLRFAYCLVGGYVSGLFVVPAAASEVPAFFFAGEPQITTYPNTLTRLGSFAFVLAYDETRRDPAWGAYAIPGTRQFGTLPRPSRFSTDTRTRARVSHDDYTNSGFDRGHVVPNFAIASRFGADAQRETFAMSNAIPQRPALNQGPWRLLEELLANKVAPECGIIWVIVGPVFRGSVERLPSGSEIPDACFMLIADETPSGPRLQAFLFEQDVARSADFRRFVVSVDVVERETGFDFFAELPDEIESRLEASTAYWLETAAVSSRTSESTTTPADRTVGSVTKARRTSPPNLPLSRLRSA